MSRAAATKTASRSAAFAPRKERASLASSLARRSPRVARIALLALVACKGKTAPKRDDASVAPPADATAESKPWPELAELPHVEPDRVVHLPSKANVPRFTVGGPVLAGELAIVASSQFGFAAVDYKRGQLAWTKPAGAHVAPPLVVESNVVLIGDCVNPPDVPDGDTLLGCARVVTSTGSDQAYVAVHAKADAVAEFAGADGYQRMWPGGEGHVIWRRGDKAVSVDLLSGVAAPADAADPPVVINYKTKQWLVRRTEDGIIEATGKPPWKTEQSYGSLLGGVYIPEQSPMVRVMSASRRGELLLFDIDATGSLHGQVSLDPVPGIGLIGHAIDSVGDVAVAVRLDTSLERDYIAGYAANALLMWTYQLPPIKRADPVGIAIAPDAVVVFHDGDTLTVLPELSAPPTAPGAVREPSKNSTP
jgi:hypothetical protein